MTDAGTRNEQEILRSWRTNAKPWATAIHERQIESRRLVTDQAVLDTVVSLAPQSVLDIGCGEGWLARALTEKGVSVTGIDATLALITEAEQLGGSGFHVLAYEDIKAHRFEQRFNLAVCNFSLLGKESVECVFDAVPALLVPGGYFVVQTLHPLVAKGKEPYQDGWREGSWAGFDSAFQAPAPWYYRTMASWLSLFPKYGMQLIEVKEPARSVEDPPASLIMVAMTEN